MKKKQKVKTKQNPELVIDTTTVSVVEREPLVDTIRLEQMMLMKELDKRIKEQEKIVR